MGIGSQSGVPRETAGQLIARIRDLRGMSQAELGELCGGAHKNSVLNWERDGPPSARISQLADALDIPESVLYELARSGGAAIRVGPDPAVELLEWLEYRIGRVGTARLLAEHALVDLADVVNVGQGGWDSRDVDAVERLSGQIKSDLQISRELADAELG